MNQQAMTRLQSDVQTMANNMMTQAICAEKGINYNQLLQTAQVAQLQNILHQDEQRKIAQVVANHYGTQNANGFFAKIKKALAGEEQQQAMPFMLNPMVQQQMVQPMVQPMLQQPVMPVQTGMVMQPVVQPVTQPVQDNRVAKLEQEMGELKELLTVMAQSLAGIPPQANPQQQQPMQQQSNAGKNIPLK